jgi:hypothetical protein
MTNEFAEAWTELERAAVAEAEAWAGLEREVEAARRSARAASGTLGDRRMTGAPRQFSLYARGVGSRR